MEFKYTDFPSAYADMLFQFNVWGWLEDTRNGKALVFQEPVTLTVTSPTHRVISDPYRNANPFFHVMETVWMFAGKWDPRWLFRFNSRMKEFSDPGPAGSMVINGAYGYRWFKHFGDQVSKVIKVLKEDPNSRQAVLAMWDPSMDLATNWKDRPCNTHIYFRVHRGTLNMTVCNRSNDFIWGMMGANAVHLTYLHELIARALDLPIGLYRVFTNNLHFYIGLYPNEKEIWKGADIRHTVYPRHQPFPLLQPNEDYRQLLQDCKCLVAGDIDQLSCVWTLGVALPMYRVYVDNENPDSILAPDWREASKQWLQRNRGTVIV